MLADPIQALTFYNFRDDVLPVLIVMGIVVVCGFCGKEFLRLWRR